MTTRERLALILTAAGGAQLVGAAAGYGGWRAAAATSGVLMVGVGVLLGLEPVDVDTGFDADGVEAVR